MDAAWLVGVMRERGIVLRMSEGKPALSGPAGSVTPALRRVLAYHREQVLALWGPIERPGPPATPAAIEAAKPESPEAYPDPLPGVTLDEALALLGAGISVLPIRADGSKGPACKEWTSLQRTSATEAQAREWWGGPRPLGLAAICGHVSCGLEMIDFDREADAVFPTWLDLVEESLPGIRERLALVRTPRGFHCWYRWGGPVPGNRKLAGLSTRERAEERAAAEAEGRKAECCLIETRGEGGYALLPGGPLAVHGSGRPYLYLPGSEHLAMVRGIDEDDRDFLLEAARSFCRAGCPAAQERARQVPPKIRADELLPGEDYERKGDWHALLTAHGWRLVGQRGEAGYWARPGKRKGWSATLGHCHRKDGLPLFRVFSSSADPFTEGKAYGLYRAYALLEHGGDFKKAAAQLRSEGYGDRSS